jgi:hypothetical protein
MLLAKTTNITGFNDLSAVEVNTEVDTALADYDPPTNAEMIARTLPTANYGTAANQTVINNNILAVDTVVDSIKLTTDKVDTAVVLDGSVYQFTANALELAPSSSGSTAEEIADAVWDELLASHVISGSAGVALNAAGVAGDPLIGEIEPASAGGDAVTLKDAMRLILSQLLGLTEGGGTDTIIFKDINNQKTRLTLTVDSKSNRLEVERDVT